MRASRRKGCVIKLPHASDVGSVAGVRLRKPRIIVWIIDEDLLFSYAKFLILASSRKHERRAKEVSDLGRQF